MYSTLYLNTLIQMSFYIRLHFYFEDGKCQVLKYSATTRESCYSQSASPGLDKHLVGHSSHVYLDVFFTPKIAFYKELTESIKTFLLHLCPRI